MPNEVMAGKEARRFAAYLGSPRVPREIVERYQEVIHAWPAGRFDRFDAWLVAVAVQNPALTPVADSYARLARPYGELRRRLTLMLALLETHGGTHARYDHARPSSSAAAWLALFGAGSLWALRTLLATVICAPAHLVLGRRTEGPGSA